MTTPNLTDNTELTFAECQEIDKFLEAYKNNPSNSNKFRIGLHAHINDLITAKTRDAYCDVGNYAADAGDTKLLNFIDSRLEALSNTQEEK